MKITSKLVLTFAAVIAISGFTGFIGLRSINVLSNDIDEIGTVRTPSIENLLTILEEYNGVKTTYAELVNDDLSAADRSTLHNYKDRQYENMSRAWVGYDKLPRCDEESEHWDRFVTHYKVWENSIKELELAISAWEQASHAQAGLDAVRSTREHALAKFSVSRKIASDVTEQLEKVVAWNSKAVSDTVAASQSHARDARALMMGSLFAMVIVASVVATIVCRGISRGFRNLVGRITEIRESNDMTRRVDASSKDELGVLGSAFNGMIQTLHDIIAEVKAGTAQIDAGGSQIASASQMLAQGASEQASSLQQISASIEEMSGQTQQSAENARQANALAEASKTSADRGQQEMAEMSKAVNEIKQSSAEISKIIKVIDEIAFQTNLLALNAAVEAARAGEAGKGFAVVAEEVRNLAQRSAEAAKNTASMIEESVKRSENGVQIAGRVGQALEEITTSTNKVNALLAEIASAAGEQATGIGQINQGVSQLDQVTQQNAGNSEEMASSAEELSSQVAALNELVAQFKVNGGVQGSAPASHAKPKTPTPAARPATVKPSVRPSASKPKAATASQNGVNPEQVIPMENDEVLASF